MTFHRLVVPVYSGGLRGGDDYINNAVAGTPAPADAALGAGTYIGSYFFAENDQVTGAAINRGLKALAQNCDFLDDEIVDIRVELAALVAADIVHTDDIAQIIVDMGALTLGAITDANTYSDAQNVTLSATLVALLDAHKANLTRVRTLTTGDTLHTPNQDSLIILNTAGGDFNLQLPNPATASSLYSVILFNEDGAMTALTNRVTLVRAGAEMINGLAADYVLNAAYGRWTLRSDGVNWVVA